MDRRESGKPTAMGREGLHDARWFPERPEPELQIADVPGTAAQAAQGRAIPRADRDHVRSRRGRAARLRRCPHRRTPLLRSRRRKPDRQEHDPRVLLRPANRQWYDVAGREISGQARRQAHRTRRRNDGRRHRLRVREGGHRRSPQGHLDRGGEQGQGLLGEARRQVRLSRIGRGRGGRTEAGRRAPLAHHPHR